MATQQHITNFENQYKAWKSIDLSKVYRDETGTLSFKSIKPLITKFNTQIERILPILPELSNSLLEQINNIIIQINGVLNTCANYNESQFIAQKTNTETQFNTHYQSFLIYWPQIVALLKDSEKKVDVDAEKLLDQIKELSKKSEKDAKTIEDLKTKLSSEINDFENRYKEQFQKAEIVSQITVFTSQASKFLGFSKYWLIGIIVSSIFLSIMLFVIFKCFCFEVSCFNKILEINYESICKDCNRAILYLEIFKAVAFRLFIISFIVYVLNFCVKNYNACMHNYTINNHKANSLDAALRLLEKAYSDNAKDNIMTQASNAIFSHQPTGYSKKDPTNTQSPITEKIIEKINPLSTS
jgi:hypothetical protein